MLTESRRELLVACVDARRPVGDYNLSMKQTRILRCLGGYIPANDPDVEAALEYAITKERIGRITIASHTDCGAACACMQKNQAVPHVLNYLKDLDPLREKIKQRFPDDERMQMREMERLIAHESLNNLRSYECVRKAEKEDGLVLRTWLVDVASGQPHDTTDPAHKPVTTPEFPPHEPQMIYFSNMDPRAPVASIGINKGQSLIVRNFSGLVPPGKEHVAAALEFAVKAKGIRKIVVGIEENCAAVQALVNPTEDVPMVARHLAPLRQDAAVVRRTHTGDVEAQKREIAKRLLAASLKNLRGYDAVQQTPGITLEAWLVDSDGKKTHIEENVNPAIRPQTKGFRLG